MDRDEYRSPDHAQPSPGHSIQGIPAIRHHGRPGGETQVQPRIEQVSHNAASICAPEIIVRNAEDEEHQRGEEGVQAPAARQCQHVRDYHYPRCRLVGDSLRGHWSPGFVDTVLEHRFRLALVVDVEGQEVDPSPEKDERYASESGSG